MGRYAQDEQSGGQSDAQHHSRFDAHTDTQITLPFDDIGNAAILRDGQDLILQSHGKTAIIEDYFSADTPPAITGQDGMALTPVLVQSFVQPAGGVQYAQAGSLDDASPVGIIHESVGDASITHPSGVTVKASIGTPVYQGDIIETKDDGAVNITFIDDTSLAVSENARMAIDEYVFDPASQSGENSFSILRGVFVYTSGLIGRDDPDDVSIHTPVGSIGIRGTTIMGDINPGGKSQITVVEGAIVITNTVGQTTLSQQFETVHLSGMNDKMGDAVILSAHQIANDYTVLRSVSAPLFSSFDDNVNNDAAADSGDESAPTPPSADSPSANSPSEGAQPAPETPVNKTDATSPGDAESGTQLAMDSTSDTVSFEAGFDQSTGIENTASLDNTPSATQASKPVTADSIFSAPPTSKPTGSDAVQSGATPPANSSVDPALLTPSGNGASTTPPATGGGGHTVPPVTTTGTIDINLDNLITTGISGGQYISGNISGARFGFNTAMLNDIDNDGNMDFAVVSNQSSDGQLFLYDGSGNRSMSYLSSAPYNLDDTTGLTVAGIGDFNRDGYNDIAIGAYMSNDPQIASGKVVIVNGHNVTGPAVLEITGFSAGHFAGYSIAGAGDFNGDGISDFIIGAPYDSGNGAAYILFGTDSYSSINVNTLNPAQGLLIPGTSGSRFGTDVAGIGDFNGDGFGDIAVSELNSGTVSIYFGNQGGVQMTPLTINGIGRDLDFGHIPVSALGDMNGDGRADFSILDVPNNTAHIFYGGNHSAGNISITSSDLKVTLSAGSEIVGFSSAGDFNGDGIGDFIMATRTGSQLDLYVFYGDSGLSGTINLDSLTDDRVFHMTLDLMPPNFYLPYPTTSDITLSLNSAGDLNNDGFDDLIIGMPQLGDDEGGLFIIHGRAESYDLATDSVHIGLIANKSGQGLIGTAGAEIMSNQNGATIHDNIAFKAGGGNDIINLFGQNARMIDGGTGHDTLNFMSGGNIDLRGLGDNLSNIENFNFNTGTTGKLTLQIDQLFQLLQQSNDGTLQFFTGTATPGSVSLQIDNNGNGKTTLADLGFTSNGTSAGVESWSFGAGYTLYIDSNVDVTVAAIA